MKQIFIPAIILLSLSACQNKRVVNNVSGSKPDISEFKAFQCVQAIRVYNDPSSTKAVWGSATESGRDLARKDVIFRCAGVGNEINGKWQCDDPTRNNETVTQQ